MRRLAPRSEIHKVWVYVSCPRNCDGLDEDVGIIEPKPCWIDGSTHIWIHDASAPTIVPSSCSFSHPHLTSSYLLVKILVRLVLAILLATSPPHLISTYPAGSDTPSFQLPLIVSHPASILWSNADCLAPGLLDVHCSLSHLSRSSPRSQSFIPPWSLQSTPEMPLSDLFRRYPEPYHHRIDHPVDATYDLKTPAVPTANEVYNNAIPEWTWDRERGGWTLVYTYQGYHFIAMPDHRITNSWYANYGADHTRREEPAWEWVWDPRVMNWVNRPVGTQVYGTARGHPPAEDLSGGQKRGLWGGSKKAWYTAGGSSGSRSTGTTWGSAGLYRAKARWDSFFGKPGMSRHGWAL